MYPSCEIVVGKNALDVGLNNDDRCREYGGHAPSPQQRRAIGAY